MKTSNFAKLSAVSFLIAVGPLFGAACSSADVGGRSPDDGKPGASDGAVQSPTRDGAVSEASAHPGSGGESSSGGAAADASSGGASSGGAAASSGGGQMGAGGANAMDAPPPYDPNDEPCPANTTMAVDCAGDACDSDSRCGWPETCSNAAGFGSFSAHRAALYVRTPSHPGSQCACANGARVLRFGVTDFDVVVYSESIRVAPPWKLAVVSGPLPRQTADVAAAASCDQAARGGTQCVSLSTTPSNTGLDYTVYVFTDDPSAPARNVVIQHGTTCD